MSLYQRRIGELVAAMNTLYYAINLPVNNIPGCSMYIYLLYVNLSALLIDMKEHEQAITPTKQAIYLIDSIIHPREHDPDFPLSMNTKFHST